MERHRHVPVERQPAAVALDGAAHEGQERRRYTGGRVGRHHRILGTMATRPVVMVTGAARRLGRAIALGLASAGHDVAVHYRQSKEQAEATVADLRAAGANAAAFAADLADEAACRALVPAVVAHFGRLDAVVNNASLFEYDAPSTFGHAAMDRHWRANVAPSVLLAQALHDHLAGRSAAGCVVNIVDQKLWNPNPDYFSYTLSKAALQAATVLLAQALAPSVRVCGVAPGVTPRVRADDRGRVRDRACADAVAALVDARRTWRAPSASCSSRRPSPAPRCWSTAASTWPQAARRAVPRAGASTEQGALMESCSRTRARSTAGAVPAQLRGVDQHRRARFEKRGEQRVLINVDLYIPLAVSTPEQDDWKSGRLRLHPPHHRQRVSRAHPPAGTLCDDILR
jgi:NAD(P)-dependent dehydrogenase (short-subunit alcohol dehydrogenase family)